MVSYPAQRRDTEVPEFDHGSSKKRKREFASLPDHLSFLPKRNKWSEFEPETPLPLEWQRCLDIKSGKIHFYNTKTQKRTLKDPRVSPDPPGSPSLELELNLPCDSQRQPTNGRTRNPYRPLGGLHPLPSWLAFEGDRGQEMVATVCAQCHLLVMLCKSTPSCPNCKFMHPPPPSNCLKLCL